MPGALDTAQLYGTVGVGTANALQRSLRGNPDLVHFIDPATSNTLLQCDAVLSETHSRESPPTSFPLEDGTTISDHIIVAPFELQLQGVISDSPISNASALISEGVATGLTAVLPPLGIAAAGAAFAVFKALDGPQRSGSAFNQLLYLQAGDPTATPPQPPKPFDVQTKFHRYPSMVIRSLSVPRDATTSNTIVFELSLVQLLIVQPQTVNVRILHNPARAARKAAEGEQDLGSESALARGIKSGVSTVDKTADAAESSVSRASSFLGKMQNLGAG